MEEAGNKDNFNKLRKAPLAWYGDDKKMFLELADKINAFRSVTVFTAYDLYKRVFDYIVDRKQTGKPVTIAGMVLASGLSETTWYDVKAGSLDHIPGEAISLYNIRREDIYTDNGILFADILPDNEKEPQRVTLTKPSELLKKLYLFRQSELEEICSTNKGNPAGAIFLLKSQHGFIEEEKQTFTDNRSITIIASPEEAKNAIKLLGD